MPKHINIINWRLITLGTTLIITVAILTTLFYLNSTPTEAHHGSGCKYNQSLNLSFIGNGAYKLIAAFKYSDGRSGTRVKYVQTDSGKERLRYSFPPQKSYRYTSAAVKRLQGAAAPYSFTHSCG